jgi:hypothetical protein
MPEKQSYHTTFSLVRPLTQEERQLARSAAQEAVQRDVGDRPNRDYFNHHAVHRYPPGVTRLINALCVALLLAAFTPNGQRIRRTVRMRLRTEVRLYEKFKQRCRSVSVPRQS